MDDKWRESGPATDIEASSWIRIFRAFDTDHDGLIQCAEMQKTIRDSTYSFGFDHYELQKMSLLLEMREGRPIDFADFCYLMSKCKGYALRENLFRAAKSVTPHSQRITVFSNLQRYKCVPPPIFMVFISIIQLAFYIYYVIDSKEGFRLNGPIATVSDLILSPHHFSQIWRYLTYSLVNVGFFHTIFNLLIQLLIGFPLELIHTWRIYLFYIFSVLFGVLLSLALDPNVFVFGAGAGSFAILGSHILTLSLHFPEMDRAIIKIPLFSSIAVIDFAIAVYQRFYAERIDKVSFYPHIGGLLAGILFTFILLGGPRSTRIQKIGFWVSLVVVAFFVAITTSLILAPNIFH